MLQSMKMDTPKKHRVHAMCHTLRECLTDEEYLKAHRRMEEIQKRHLRMLKNEDIEPTDWDVIDF